MLLLDIEQTNKLGFDWHNINWRRVKTQVNKLQKRIFWASFEKRWRNVKSLQKLLVRSRSAKLLAINRILHRFAEKLYVNSTAGIDDKFNDTANNLYRFLQEFNFADYHPKPVARVYIPKSNGGNRPLGIPTLEDKLVQKLVMLALEPEWEAKFEPNSFGYRKNRNPHDAVLKVQNNLNEIRCLNEDKINLKKYCWVLIGDIASFFERINQEAFLNKIIAFRPIIKRWLKVGAKYQGRLLNTDVGVPQGSVIGSLLANIALDGLERLFGIEDSSGDYIPPSKRKGINRGVSLIRFADDFVVIAPSKVVLEFYILPKIKTFLERMGLNLNESKTKIVRSDECFDFLGFTLRQKNLENYSTIFCTPSNKSVEKLLYRIEDILLNNISISPSRIIHRINSIIRKWAKYYRYCQSKAIFQQVDHEIRKLLWQWHAFRNFNSTQLAIPTTPNMNRRCGWLRQLIKLKKYGGDVNINDIHTITRKFSLIPECHEDLLEIETLLIKLRALKNLYVEKMIDYIKHHSYDRFAHTPLHKIRAPIYDNLGFSKVASPSHKAIALKERAKRCAYYEAYHAVRNWVIRAENIKLVIDQLIRLIQKQPSIANRFLKGKRFAYPTLKQIRSSLKEDCFGNSQFISVFFLDNLIGHVKNLFFDGFELDSKQPTKIDDALMELITLRLNHVKRYTYDLLRIPKFKGLSSSIVNAGVYKADYDNFSVKLGFRPYRWLEFKILSAKERITQLCQEGFKPDLPVIKLKDRKLITHLPFERIKKKELQPKHPNVELGIDLGLKHFAVVSVRDKQQNVELARYFLGAKELFDKTFHNGKITPQKRFATDNTHSNIKLKLTNLRKQIKQIQKKKDNYENRLLERGIKDFSAKLKWNKIRKTLSNLWSRANRLNLEIVHHLNHYIMEIARYHGASTIKMEDLRWVKPSKRKDIGKFLAFWQIHRFFSQAQRAIEHQCKLNSVQFTRTPAAYTSQICSHCGKKGVRRKKLFSCPSCGLSLDSDLNAARNIAQFET